MYVERLQIRYNFSVMYPIWIGATRPRKYRGSFDDYAGTQYSGNVSSGSIKRIRKAVDLLLQLSPEVIIYNPISQQYHPFQISFITLTIADQIIRDPREVFAKCMVPFLQWLRSKGCKHYIWKAELQARGQVHYHITINKFVLWHEIKSAWNKYQKKAGYLQNYAIREGHFHPNSIDVHAVTKIRDIGAYLVKYIAKKVSKNDPTKTIPGKIWGCSNSLNSKYFSIEYENDEANNIDRIATTSGDVIRTEQCLIVKRNYTELLNIPHRNQYHLFLTNLNS